MSVSVSSSKAIEKQLIGVKKNCKFAYNCLNDRQQRLSNMMDKTEAMIIANPDNDAMKRLWLSHQEILEWEKTVASWRNDEGKTDGFQMPIRDNEHWDVQITRKGKVRACLTPAGRIYAEGILTPWMARPEFRVYY